MAGAGGPHFSKEDIDRTWRMMGHAAYVIMRTTPTRISCISPLFEPEYGRIFVDYESGVHEERSHELRERLARTLDYNVELV